MKRTLAVLVVTVLAALIGVAAFAQTAKTPVTLSIIANQDWVTKPYVKAAWANYENVTGNKLDIQALPIDNWETVMKTRAAAGELPDIVMTFAGPVLDAMRPAENFFDLSNEPFVKDLKPFVLPQVTYKGKIYGLPLWEGSVSGTLYNKDIFKKLSISVPKTQAEFWAACDTIKKAGITPIYLAFKDIWPALPQFGLDPMAKKYSGFVDKLNSNKLTFAGVPEFTNLVSFYRKLVDKGYLGADFVSNTWDGQAKALGEGTYAMALAWDQYLYSDLEPRYAGAAAHFGIMPFFMGVAPEGSYEGPNACMTFVNKKGKNAQEGLAFLRFLAKPENLNLAYKDVFTESYFKSVTTNRVSPQVAEARTSVDKLILASVQAGIVGYSQVESVKPIQMMMLDQLSVADTVKQIDDIRIKVAKARGLAGF